VTGEESSGLCFVLRSISSGDRPLAAHLLCLVSAAGVQKPRQHHGAGSSRGETPLRLSRTISTLFKRYVSIKLYVGFEVYTGVKTEQVGRS
jgi:hypothetical protein